MCCCKGLSESYIYKYSLKLSWWNAEIFNKLTVRAYIYHWAQSMTEYSPFRFVFSLWRKKRRILRMKHRAAERRQCERNASFKRNMNLYIVFVHIATLYSYLLLLFPVRWNQCFVVIRYRFLCLSLFDATLSYISECFFFKLIRRFCIFEASTWDNTCEKCPSQLKFTFSNAYKLKRAVQ